KGSPFGRAPDEQGEAGERAFLQPSALSPLRLASQATSPVVGGFWICAYLLLCSLYFKQAPYQGSFV
ncbi:MAG: hypothetical protein J6U86_00840, partial [Clostridia bacterium]|nr:hypothetical protein [Clostridia bacterium]